MRAGEVSWLDSTLEQSKLDHTLYRDERCLDYERVESFLEKEVRTAKKATRFPQLKDVRFIRLKTSLNVLRSSIERGLHFIDE
ncbi:hypothetical protein GCM10009021_24400 [Halarchaeum nitratireducens]|uniref:Uncharacterized protein n=1 Tax=Halarchaeum nitratireducens TaxID=489913 RepID=A0A830GDV9_9EURY|nr:MULTISPECIES: hypothetical protein [Halarchaeum]MBP2251079.1 hypothetical protein [Halarchaeum solikamskense]GGN22080.1 hypothetical protein GCM10009021_24400 [Halarchaeum nitratireducens]